MKPLVSSIVARIACASAVVSVPVQFGDQSPLPREVDLALSDLARGIAKCFSIVCLSMAIRTSGLRTQLIS